ncbi:MAG TPA: hypothetical protein VK497_01565 [Candidatus Saccharimonadales bacterium]|nr:hypothetical protein [Candidatus Saccharimonadales bacterium]
MSRAVVIGGVGNGKKSVGGYASAVEAHHGNDLEDLAAFTLSDAISNPLKLAMALKDASAYTTSGGYVAAVEAIKHYDAKPETIDALSPPIPTPLLRLIGRQTLAKTWDMHLHADFSAVRKYDHSTTEELFHHPWANMRTLPRISRFDAIAEAGDIQQSGIPVAIGYMTEDRYFMPTPAQWNRAERLRINMFRVIGMHDQIILHPAEALSAYMQEKAKGNII